MTGMLPVFRRVTYEVILARERWERSTRCSPSDGVDVYVPMNGDKAGMSLTSWVHGNNLPSALAVLLDSSERPSNLFLGDMRMPAGTQAGTCA